MARVVSGYPRPTWQSRPRVIKEPQSATSDGPRCDVQRGCRGHAMIVQTLADLSLVSAPIGPIDVDLTWPRWPQGSRHGDRSADLLTRHGFVRRKPGARCRLGLLVPQFAIRRTCPSSPRPSFEPCTAICTYQINRPIEISVFRSPAGVRLVCHLLAQS